MSDPANTFGFDTVFAVPVSQVNQKIIAFKSSPKTLDFKSDDGTETCQGTFGDWQICLGGDGANVRLSIPVHDITATVPVGNKQASVTCDQLVAVVQVKLNYLDHDDPPTARKLVVRSVSDDTQDPVAVVLPLDLSKSQAQSSLSFITPADALQGVIEDWCNANMGMFAHIFALVDINTEIDHGEFAFCKPRITDYAYVGGDTLDDSILGVLCMTCSSNDPMPNIQQISSYAIPPGASAGFLIAPRRMLGDLMLPYFEQVWPSAGADDFQFDEDGLVLSLIEGHTITIPKIQTDKNSYEGTLTSLKVSIEVDVLKFESYTTTELSPGITAWCSATHWYSISLDSSRQALVFAQAQTPQQTNGVLESQALQDAEFWTELALGVAAALITILSAGTGALVAAVVLGLAGVAMNAIIKGIETSGQDDAPPVNMLAYNATNPIQWVDKQTFTLTSARLNGCLQLGGTLEPSP